MLDKLKKINEQSSQEINDAKNFDQLKIAKSHLLGKNSQLAKIISALASLDKSAKIEVGKSANELKKTIESKIDNRYKQLVDQKKDRLECFDITKPGEFTKNGHLHPVSMVLSDSYDVFSRLGFAIIDGPEIESDWYNFEALNIPQDHPARDMQDTFYLNEEYDDSPMVARTQTSAMQVRYMEKHKPPFKIIVPGKVFRNENEDATHSWIFNQIEGLVVGENVSFADLKGTLTLAISEVLGEKIEVRLRPSYFPYTEPSVAGMVHPSVLKKGGIDPEVFGGFAFGWGADRLAVIKYGISDLRMLWRPRFNYLEQF
jgi:phenylalanyl-tRNA synthetase alpha chain